MGALSNFVNEHFGVDTVFKPNPLATTIGIGVTELWRNNPDRLMLSFINLGATNAYINVGPDVAADNGILLAAGGGSVVFTAEDDGELVGYPFWGYAAVATDIFSGEVEGA